MKPRVLEYLLKLVQSGAVSVEVETASGIMKLVVNQTLFRVVYVDEGAFDINHIVLIPGQEGIIVSMDIVQDSGYSIDDVSIERLNTLYFFVYKLTQI